MVVIYAEKHSLAKEIAQALHAGRRIACEEEPTIAHWEFDFNGENAVICHGTGHLAELVPAKAYGEQFEKWDLDKYPCVPDEMRIAPKTITKTCFQYVKSFFDKADWLINATDADREGELIFAYVMQAMNCTKPWKRVWIDDLTDEKLRYAFAHLKNGADMKHLQEAGRARDTSDWLIGCNMTIAATKKFGSPKNLLSVGRVQTPTLNLVVQRERAIKNHIKTPYWKLYGVFSTQSGTFQSEFADGKFDNEKTAKETLEQCKGNKGIVIKLETKKKTENAPLLFNSTQLQATASKKLNWELDKTVKVMQNLYEHKLMSYPRTSTEHLTVEMQDEVSETIAKLMEIPEYTQYALPREQWTAFSKRHFDNEKVGSHTAIIPTIAVPQSLDSLSLDEKLLYDIIVKSLLRIVYPKVEIQDTSVLLDVNGNKFKANGKVVTNKGWYLVDAEPEQKTSILPPVSENESYAGEFRLESGETEPPKRFTEADLILSMELAGQKLEDEEARTLMKLKKMGLGTDATRTAIIKGLFDKDYLQKRGKSIIPTDKAFFLIDSIPIEEIKSAEITGQWEMRLNEIAEGRLDYEKYLAEIKETTKRWFLTIKQAEGERFVSEAEKQMICPFCHKQLFKTKTGYGCSGYKDGCKFFIKSEICGKKITESQALLLITSGKTGIIKGFVSAKSGKKFDAALKINKAENKIDFDFPAQKKRK